MPLFGGLKATFVTRYGIPLQDFLFESSDGSPLTSAFGCPLVETVADKLTINAFVHDPLINWRLFNFNEVPQISTSFW
ncbi:unnamed protein product [Camellia sinensis]